MDTYIPSVEQLEQADLLMGILKDCGASVAVICAYGLDGLLGRLTRDHGDFDLMVKSEGEAEFRKIIEARGFSFKEDEGEKVIYDKDGLKLEFITSDQLAQYAEGLDMASFFPEKPNANLRGCAFRTPTLEAHKWIIETQNKRASEGGWGDYPHREHQEQLIAILDAQRR